MEICIDILIPLLGLVAVTILYWWYLWRKDKKRVVHVRRRYEVPLVPHVSRFTDSINVLYLERLSPKACEALCSGYPVASLEDYLNTLDVPEEIDTEEAAATLFDALGLSFALPLLSLLPKEWRRQKARPLDLACSKYAHALLALSSPLTAAGIWTMLFKAKARGDIPDSSEDAVRLLVSGEPLLKPNTPPIRLPNPVTLAIDLRDAVVSQLHVDEHTPRAVLEPGPAVSPRFFPDLYHGEGGLTTTYTPYELGLARGLCMVLNKLTANLVPAHFLPPGCERPLYHARLHPGGPLYTAPDQLLGALASLGHVITANVVSRMTSFGKCLCVRQPDGGFVNIPFNIPMRTGVKRMGPGAEGWEDIVMPSLHGEVDIDIGAGPVFPAPIQIVWFQSIDGYTGFFLRQVSYRPWQNGIAGTVRSHLAQPWQGEQLARAIRAATVLSVACNVAASRSRLPKGGYGVTGLCIDAVACVQASVDGSTSLYPLTATGEGQMDVVLALSELCDELGGSRPDLAASCQAVIGALARLPSDIVVRSQYCIETLGRMSASLPRKSVFGLADDAANHIRETELALRR